MSSPLSDTYPVAGYISQLSHTSIPPLQNDDNRLPALRGGADCLDITLQRAHHSAGHEILFRSKRAHRNDGEPIH